MPCAVPLNIDNVNLVDLLKDACQAHNLVDVNSKIIIEFIKQFFFIFEMAPLHLVIWPFFFFF